MLEIETVNFMHCWSRFNPWSGLNDCFIKKWY